MKLTIEDNPEAIKRYRHIKPAPHGGASVCSARCPGSARTCTLKRGHSGPHVTHGTFRKILAVWDKGLDDRKSDETARQARSSLARRNPREEGFLSSIKSTVQLFIPRFHSVEDVALLILALGFIWFAIEWALRIMGAW